MIEIPELDELERQMIQAFQSGDLPAAALAIWQLECAYPDASNAQIIKKKILRMPDIETVSEAQLIQEIKALVKNSDYKTAAAVVAFGLVFVKQTTLLLRLMLELAGRLTQYDWLKYVVERLDSPKDDDFELLSAHGIVAQLEKRYREAYEFFEIIRAAQPGNERAEKNVAAALAAMGSDDAAIDLLEATLAEGDDPPDTVRRLLQLYRNKGLDVEKRLRELDEEYFYDCSNSGNAAAHACLSVFLQDFPEAWRGIEKRLAFENALVEDTYNAAELLLNLGRFDEAMPYFEQRFEALPHLKQFESTAEKYSGQVLNQEKLFLWFEQGIGEEILFGYFLDTLYERVQHATVCMDPRILRLYAKKYPRWEFVGRDVCDSAPMPDFICASGDLFKLLLPETLAKHDSFPVPFVQPDEQLKETIVNRLGAPDKSRLGVSWRGGSKAAGRIRSMDLDQLMTRCPESLQAEIFSLQYDGAANKEALEYDDERLTVTGIDNFNDLEGVMAFLSTCDAVCTVDNAVAHFACALGIPTAVLVPAGQVQFRWKNERLRRLFFPSAKVFVQEKAGDWSAAIDKAWAWVAEQVDTHVGERK